MKRGHSSLGRSCPIPGIATARPPGSPSRWRARAERHERVVRAVDHHGRHVELAAAPRCASPTPGSRRAGEPCRRGGGSGRSRGGLLAHALLVQRVAGRADHPEHAHEVARCTPRDPRGARRISTLQTRSFGVPDPAVAGGRQHRPSDSTRSGLLIAIVWAIIPPIDAPTTCARSIPRWSSRPSVSSAMSCEQVGRRDPAARPRPHHVRHRARRSCVDRPTSRLSKRITWKPRSARRSQKLAVPVDQLHPQPHHQQQRRVGWVADRLVDQLDRSDVRALFASSARSSTRVRETLTVNLKLLVRR